jgi:hypothetical protein
MLAHSFRGFGPWSVGSIALGLGKANIIVAGSCSRGCSPHSHQEDDRGNRKGLWLRYTLQRNIPSDPLLIRSPIHSSTSSQQSLQILNSAMDLNYA